VPGADGAIGAVGFLLRGFGLKVGKTTPARFAERIKQLVVGHPHLEAIAESLLTARVALRREFNRLEKQVRAMADATVGRAC
jgi:transposase